MLAGSLRQRLRKPRLSGCASCAVVLRPFLRLIPERLTHCAPAVRDASLDKGVGSQSAGNFPKNSGIFVVHHSFTRVGSNSDIVCCPGFTLPRAASAKERPRSVTSDMQDEVRFMTT